MGSSIVTMHSIVCYTHTHETQQKKSKNRKVNAEERLVIEVLDLIDHEKHGAAVHIIPTANY